MPPSGRDLDVEQGCLALAAHLDVEQRGAVRAGVLDDLEVVVDAHARSQVLGVARLWRA